MNRRDTLLALIALGMGSMGLQAQQVDRVWRIGLLTSVSQNSPFASSAAEVWKSAMNELGYTGGKNLIVMRRDAYGREDQIANYVDEFIRAKVDLIFAYGAPAALAAQKGTSTIPIFIYAVTDPVGLGLVESLARPGKNITGVSTQGMELVGKRIEVLRAIVPKLTRLAVLLNPQNAKASAIYLKLVQEASGSLGIKVTSREASNEAQLASAFAKMAASHADAVMVGPDVFLPTKSRQIAALATKHKIPAMYPNNLYAEAGGLVTYGEHIPDSLRRSWVLIDKILKGANPADIPVEQPMNFELIINMKTAKAIGVKIPQSVLLSATKVIE